MQPESTNYCYKIPVAYFVNNTGMTSILTLISFLHYLRDKFHFFLSFRCLSCKGLFIAICLPTGRNILNYFYANFFSNISNNWEEKINLTHFSFKISTIASVVSLATHLIASLTKYTWYHFSCPSIAVCPTQ